MVMARAVCAVVFALLFCHTAALTVSKWQSDYARDQVHAVLTNLDVVLSPKAADNKDVATMRSLVRLMKQMKEDKLEATVKGFDDEVEQRVSRLSVVDQRMVEHAVAEAELYAQTHKEEIQDLMSCFVSNFTGGFTGDGCDPSSLMHTSLLHFTATMHPDSNETATAPSPNNTVADVKDQPTSREDVVQSKLADKQDAIIASAEPRTVQGKRDPLAAVRAMQSKAGSQTLLVLEDGPVTSSSNSTDVLKFVANTLVPLVNAGEKGRLDQVTAPELSDLIDSTKSIVTAGLSFAHLFSKTLEGQ